MKLQFAMIRAGITLSGVEGRYLGLSDEPLTPAAEIALARRVDQGTYPNVPLVYTSELQRCRQTSALLHPRSPAVFIKDLRPLDIGEFEGRTHNQLIGDPDFQEWAQSGFTVACPGGENPHQFSVRSVQAFRGIVDEMNSKGIETVSIISHKLVIGAILQRFCIPRSAYRSWDMGYGCGYFIEFDSALSTAKILSII